MRRAAAVILLMGLLLAGCDGGDDTAALEQRITELEQQLAVATSTTVAATTTTVSTTTTAATSGERVLVYGTADCETTVDFDAGTDEGWRTVYVMDGVCTTTSSDPRVSGREEFHGTYVMFGDATVAQWTCEEMVLTTEGGTWRGSCWGTDTWDERNTMWVSGLGTYAGEGAYAGLAYYEFIAMYPESDGYRYIGWIEPAE